MRYVGGAYSQRKQITILVIWYLHVPSYLVHVHGKLGQEVLCLDTISRYISMYGLQLICIVLAFTQALVFGLLTLLAIVFWCFRHVYF